ncbi:MAG: hypothetical protein KA184_22235, partial [Candidatus Hydrogenedentes bacterium]|nr:hypothetical protein [Candidatus Hydrogenedentota bacterium]
YRRELKLFDEKLRERLSRHLSLAPSVEVPHRSGVVVLVLTIGFIASHRWLEGKLGLAQNSILLVAPLMCSGVIMIVRHERARHYVEAEVDWWTLLFFMLLFAVAGTLEHTGVTEFAAQKLAQGFGRTVGVLVPVIMATAAIGSAFVDNVIFVAAFSPVIKELGKEVSAMPLWWALLFGACFGGNITMIGSTANIVALGLLEKHSRIGMRFFQWFKVGLISALVACLVAWALLMLVSPLMPEMTPSAAH